MRPEELLWVGGEDEFALTVMLIGALEKRANGDGIGLIYQRLINNTFRHADVIDVVTLGLEGGGMSRQEAKRKVETLWEDYGYDGGENGLRLTAVAILGAAMAGWPGEEVKTEDEVAVSDVDWINQPIFREIYKGAYKLGIKDDELAKLGLAEFYEKMTAHQEYHGKQSSRKPEAIPPEKLEELGIGQTYTVN